MRTAASWSIRLLAAALLVLGQGLAYQPGEALAQGSLKQLTESPDPYETYSYPTISADGTRIAFWSEGLQDLNRRQQTSGISL